MMMLLITTIMILGFTYLSIMSFPVASPSPSSRPIEPPEPNLGIGLPPHFNDLIDPTLSCSSDWQCPYHWYCLDHTCTKEDQLDENRLTGSAFALAIQSLLVFGSLTLFLCSPCLILIFFGYFLGYCPTGAVDRSKGSGVVEMKQEVTQEMMVVKKRRGERVLVVGSGKSKKAVKVSEAQAQVLAQVNQLMPAHPQQSQVIESVVVLEPVEQSKAAEDKSSQIELSGKLIDKKADDDIGASFKE